VASGLRVGGVHKSARIVHIYADGVKPLRQPAGYFSIV